MSRINEMIMSVIQSQIITIMIIITEVTVIAVSSPTHAVR